MNQSGTSTGRTWVRRAGVTTAVLAAAIGLATPAMAAATTTAQPTYTTQRLPSGAVTESVTIPAGMTTVHFGTGAAQATVTKMSPNTTINCHVTANEPREFAGTGGPWANANAYASCTAPVAHMYLQSELLQNGTAVYKDVQVNNDTAYESANAAARCVHGDGYETRGVTYVVYPAGFTPPNWESKYVYSDARILC